MIRIHKTTRPTDALPGGFVFLKDQKGRTSALCVGPGPNSNTFTAWIAQQVPDLELDLPFTAIGAGYLD